MYRRHEFICNCGVLIKSYNFVKLIQASEIYVCNQRSCNFPLFIYIRSGICISYADNSFTHKCYIYIYKYVVEANKFIYICYAYMNHRHQTPTSILYSLIKNTNISLLFELQILFFMLNYYYLRVQWIPLKYYFQFYIFIISSYMIN